MRKYDLPCLGSRKSFYGKAHIIELDDGTKQLESYNTIVCELSPAGSFTRLWNGYSATTVRHVNSFLSFLGYNNGGKAFWDACQVNKATYL